ncbi:YncE family protein [Nocardioides sp. LS1]|uniref:YncE family protein n=1 Tax=Nocardioides sp. LS1 TaxID=1027620 RepID=UPI000F621B6D|nr:YncE family protein [Nocardioides sp. LS1]
MPRNLASDVYAAARPGRLRQKVARDPAYLYVPNSYGAPVTTVIDQRTRKVVRVLRTGSLSQHVTPSYDLSRLYVEASYSNQIDVVDPRTGRITRRYPVDRPYNLYFTPDGRHAIVMDEEHQRIVFADPRTFRPQRTLSDPTCDGPNHADFSADGRSFIVTCEFSGSLLKISTLGERVVGRLDLGPGSKPQDVRLSPDGRWFYVADMGRDLLLRIGWRDLRVVGSTPTPMMPHGIYPSRDGRFLYLSDRGAGEVSVFSLARRRIVANWPIPGGGTPDMGGVSADGRTLWLTGRYTGYVYGWNTRTGKLVAKIWVGGSPHGMLVWPQPGRYSLGHTGNLR